MGVYRQSYSEANDASEECHGNHAPQNEMLRLLNGLAFHVAACFAEDFCHSCPSCSIGFWILSPVTGRTQLILQPRAAVTAVCIRFLCCSVFIGTHGDCED